MGTAVLLVLRCAVLYPESRLLYVKSFSRCSAVYHGKYLPLALSPCSSGFLFLETIPFHQRRLLWIGEMDVVTGFLLLVICCSLVFFSCRGLQKAHPAPLHIHIALKLQCMADDW